ncbi:MAG: cytochrome c oxidase subunit II [Verrucomicrobiales bacterium]|nr:cytochrome c oxidase subunit II [Verrucomicrobiales bacterium]
MNLEWINDVTFMHEIASKHGLIGNHMLAIVHWFMLFLFIGWSIFLGIILYKFRAKKNPKANYHGITSHFSTHIEVGVVIVEIVLLMGFAFPLWAKRVDLDERPTGDDVVNLRAVGEQYRWNFHYAGADKTVGITSYERINSGSNPIGLVAEDPNAKDDFVSTRELVLPKGRPCVIQVTSKDVIHGLAIIPMFVQQDAIPGQEIPMWFVPTKTGTWDIVCAQLCGASHAKMTATIEVKSSEEFDEWYAEQRPLLPQD